MGKNKSSRRGSAATNGLSETQLSQLQEAQFSHESPRRRRRSRKPKRTKREPAQPVEEPVDPEVTVEPGEVEPEAETPDEVDASEVVALEIEETVDPEVTVEPGEVEPEAETADEVDAGEVVALEIEETIEVDAAEVDALGTSEILALDAAELDALSEEFADSESVPEASATEALFDDLDAWDIEPEVLVELELISDPNEEPHRLAETETEPTHTSSLHLPDLLPIEAVLMMGEDSELEDWEEDTEIPLPEDHHREMTTGRDYALPPPAVDHALTADELAMLEAVVGVSNLDTDMAGMPMSVDLTQIEVELAGIRIAVEDLGAREPEAAVLQPALEGLTACLAAERGRAEHLAVALRDVGDGVRGVRQETAATHRLATRSLVGIETLRRRRGSRDPSTSGSRLAAVGRGPVLAGLGVLLVTWAVVLYAKTGSAALAVAGLAAANVVGCLSLFGHRLG